MDALELPVVSRADVDAALPPGFLRDVVDYACGQTEAPAVFALGGALSALSVIAPDELSIYHGGSPLYPTLFTLFVGLSGTARKTAGLRQMQKLVAQVDPTLLGDHPDSVEGCKEALIQQPKQALCYEEMGNFLSVTTEGSRLSGLRTLFTDVYDGGSVSRRLAARQVRTESARLTLLGASTVTFLEQYTTDTDWTGGFLSRWCFLLGKREGERKSTTKEDPTRLAQLAARLASYRDVIVGPCTGLSPDAFDVWDAWYATMDGKSDSADTHPWLRGPLNRAQNVALKVALLQALAEGSVDDGPWELPLSALHVGLAVAAMHVRSAEALVADMAGSDYQRWRRQVIDFVGRAPRARSEVARLLRIAPRDLKSVLDGLAEEGRIEEKVGRGGISIIRARAFEHETAAWALGEAGRLSDADTDDEETANVIAFPTPGPRNPRQATYDPDAI